MQKQEQATLHQMGRSLRGNVDRNDTDDDNKLYRFGRSLRGNVDRNRQYMPLSFKYFVVPYVGTWIEMSPVLSGPGSVGSFPTWERG